MPRLPDSNPSLKTLYKREWSKKNPGKNLEYARAYKARNPEKVRQHDRENQRRWRKENPDRAAIIAKNYKQRYPERVAAQNKTSKSKKPEKYQAILKKAELKYRCAQAGISVDDYYAANQRQGGKCLICGTVPKDSRLCCDHSHETRKFRGLLCRQCNLGIGNLKDSPGLLRKAANYLETSPL